MTKSLSHFLLIDGLTIMYPLVSILNDEDDKIDLLPNFIFLDCPFSITTLKVIHSHMRALVHCSPLLILHWSTRFSKEV